MVRFRDVAVLEPGEGFSFRILEGRIRQLMLAVVRLDTRRRKATRTLLAGSELGRERRWTVEPGEIYVVELVGAALSGGPPDDALVELSLTGAPGRRPWFEDFCSPEPLSTPLVTYGRWKIRARDAPRTEDPARWGELSPEDVLTYRPRRRRGSLTVGRSELLRELDLLGSHLARRQGPAEESRLSDERLLDILANLEPPEEQAVERSGPKLSVERPAEGAEPEDAAPPDDEPPPRVVSTGFAPPDRPDEVHDARRPLVADQLWYFWLEVGAPVAGRADEGEVSIDVDLPTDARLEIVLFGFDGELVLEEGKDSGELRLTDAGTFVVSRPAAEPAGLVDPGLLERRLFFPVRTPQKGAARRLLAGADAPRRLRANVYYRGVLLQSHLVEARVASPEDLVDDGLDADAPRAIATRLDYKIREDLGAQVLGCITPHRLSVLLNDNGDGTHGFRFYGTDGVVAFHNDATITGQELQAKIARARENLRLASWGKKSEWNGEPDLYESPPSSDRLLADLLRLAKWGHRFYVDLVGRLVAKPGMDPVARKKRRRELERLTLAPGRVQLAGKVDARHVVPAALLYDHKLADDVTSDDRFELCPAFVEALDRKLALADTGCFRGACPSREDRFKVCPSGFWGFRHAIGFPTCERRDATLEIPHEGTPRLLVSVSTDPDFKKREPHEKKIQALLGGAADAWRHALDRDRTLELMKKDDAQLVYFYCHGGLSSDGVPYLEVGRRRAPEKITRVTLDDADVLWERHPPLVFINGCHTTALDPEVVTDLVSGFRDANAVGVVGTEITIFEPLACDFAEAFLSRFLAGDEVGACVRHARLALLQKKNPLGLVYVPFVLASVKLRRSA